MSTGQSKLYKHFSLTYLSHMLHTYLHKIGFNILSMHAGTYAARHIKIHKQALFHPPMLLAGVCWPVHPLLLTLLLVPNMSNTCLRFNCQAFENSQENNKVIHLSVASN